VTHRWVAHQSQTRQPSRWTTSAVKPSLMVQLLFVGWHNRLWPTLLGRDTHPQHLALWCQTLVHPHAPPGITAEYTVTPTGNYKAMYTTVAYIDHIPLPDGLVGHWLNYANNNTTWYATYGPLDHVRYGYETTPEFPFRLQPIDMTPSWVIVEPCVDPNNVAPQNFKFWNVAKIY
jgi:hypothetical protein